MIEIEKRVLLNRKQFATLFQFLNKNAKGLGNFKRFSLINQERGDFIPDETALTDTRIRTTGDKGRLTLKYGSWHEASSREEYEVDFKSSQISELLNIYRILGNNYYVTTYIHRHEFEYRKLKITLDKYYSSDNALMEVEVMAKDTKNLPAIEKEINEFLDYQNLTALDSKGMVKYIQGLNAIKKLRVDFTKTTVEKWYKKWKDYVFCLK